LRFNPVDCPRGEQSASGSQKLGELKRGELTRKEIEGEREIVSWWQSPFEVESLMNADLRREAKKGSKKWVVSGRGGVSNI